jgi:hypothetical protein
VRTIDGFGQPPATVTAITSLGRSMMKRFPRDLMAATARP